MFDWRKFVEQHDQTATPEELETRVIEMLRTI